MKSPQVGERERGAVHKLKKKIQKKKNLEAGVSETKHPLPIEENVS